MNILYEDNHLIVCVKEPGVLSQAGSLDMPDMLTKIKAYIKEKYNKPGNVYLGLVHRLDLNVGGVMVFAKTSKAAKRLNEQIRYHSIEKKYLAVVIGALDKNKIYSLENYIIKDTTNKKAIISNKENGKYAKLSFKVIENLVIDKQIYSLIDIDLETGRFHQIRVQLANINHPLYGDNKYGPKTLGYELGLYAYSLSFYHPTKKEKLIFTHYPNEGIFKNYKKILKGN
ncbi:MAG: RluA family pseudouridine synthase [Candidatus Izimaplasma sp.]|nr:RluA family pseudouridine synthase [Candidatus Izimaplasma bacterium]